MRKIVAVIGLGLSAALFSLASVASDAISIAAPADMFHMELAAIATDPAIVPAFELTVADEDAATLADTGIVDAWAGHALSPPSESSPTSKANMIATVKYVNPSG